MPRILLLCFIHGFKGSDNTFRAFPEDLKRNVSQVTEDHEKIIVETVVYPKYETKGELSEASKKFLEWLKERVMDLRKAHLETPWPPNDKQVGVILVAHSMGGFVASDALFLALDERRTSDNPDAPLFPPIQGLLAFDTPYNGLSRSMFVYGAFSNYSKVQTVFNVMTALSAGPVALGRALVTDRTRKAGTSGAAAASGASSANVGWKMWQLVAVRTGTVGAIAAGGVAAYTHRKAILAGMQKVRNLDRQSLVEGYQYSVDAIGQGLAYINRRNVGESFAWLSAHFTFVGALLKPQQLSLRLQRLAALRGIGVHDFYVSLGENGYWSGGYFVPERTFCAVPQEGGGSGKDDGKDGGSDSGNGSGSQPENAGVATAALFERWTMKKTDDEVKAHMGLFKPENNAAYEEMTRRAAVLVAGWFDSDEPIFDDPKFAEMAAAAEKSSKEEEAINVTDDGVEITDPKLASPAADIDGENKDDAAADELPDESPIDIAATASLMDDEEGGEGEETGKEKGGPAKGDPAADKEATTTVEEDAADRMVDPLGDKPIPPEEKANYLRHLMAVAQDAGTGLKRVSDWSYRLPSKMPRIDGISRSSMASNMPSLPSMPSLSKSASTLLPSTSKIPGASMFSRKAAESNSEKEETSEEAPKADDRSTQAQAEAAAAAAADNDKTEPTKQDARDTEIGKENGEQTATEMQS